MKSTGHWSPTEDDFDLQGHIDETLKQVKGLLAETRSITPSLSQTNEVKKAIINYLVETL